MDQSKRKWRIAGRDCPKMTRLEQAKDFRPLLLSAQTMIRFIAVDERIFMNWLNTIYEAFSSR